VPGFASRLIQARAFFAIGLALSINGEKPHLGSLAALALCARRHPPGRGDGLLVPIFRRFAAAC